MGDLVLVGSCSGHFVALDRVTGAEVWRYDTRLDGTPAQFHGDPLVAGDVAVVGSDRTSLSHTYGFEVATGNLVWKVGGSALESDIVPAGQLAVGRRWNGDLLALDPLTGERYWTLGPEDYTYRYRTDHSPAARGDTVWFGTVDGKIQAVDGLTGDVHWSTPVGEAFTTSVALAGDDLYVGTAGRELLRLSAAGGAITGRVAVESWPTGTPAVADDAVLVLSAGILMAFARDLSSELWTVESDRRWTTVQPLVREGVIVVGSYGGKVRAFRTADGAKVFAFDLEGKIRGLGTHEEVLYVGTLAGNIYACQPSWQ